MGTSAPQKRQLDQKLLNFPPTEGDTVQCSLQLWAQDSCCWHGDWGPGDTKNKVPSPLSSPPLGQVPSTLDSFLTSFWTVSRTFLGVFFSRTKKGSQHHYSTSRVYRRTRQSLWSIVPCGTTQLSSHRGGLDLGLTYLRMTDNRHRLFIPAASHKKGNSVTW